MKHPETIAYCWQQEIRWEHNSDEIYLLHKTQMNGAHAELYSYVLYLELDKGWAQHSLGPLRLESYQSVSMIEIEPHVVLVFERSGHPVSFAVESEKGQFRVYTRLAELLELPEVETALCAQGQFSAHADELTRLVPRQEIHQMLQDLAEILANLPNY